MRDDRTYRRGAVGRPRQWNPDTEIQLLLDAALTAMRRNGFADVTVEDILEEASLSTRAFYRHFASKDALLCALVRRDTESAVRRLRKRVGNATSPRERLETWIDEVLSVGFQPRRAERMAVLGSKAARLAEGYDLERTHATKQLTEPLIEVLEDGHLDGSFPDTDPTVDAWMIHTLVSGMLERPPARTRRQAVRQVLRFCLPALGADPGT